jgi:hypothetical protein
MIQESARMHTRTRRAEVVERTRAEEHGMDG